MVGIHPIILGSASPRRAQILEQVEILFEIIPSTFDEASVTIEDPLTYVKTLALKKAEFVPCINLEERIILTADTIVVLDNHILEKPKSEEEAFKFLSMLSGRHHRVITAFCLFEPKTSKKIIEAIETTVHFKQLSAPEINYYIGTKEPFDKAGAYGIQGIGASFVTKIEGDFYNVMGLPIQRVVEKLQQFNIE